MLILSKSRDLMLLILFFLVSFFTNNYAQQKPTKIVGILAAHNESTIIATSLLTMACYTDAIVVLNDASQDRTLEIIESLKKTCNIEKILHKKEWVRDERADKNNLLYAGREIGGTHFILLDADELFMATCQENNWLRNKILRLKPGQILKFPMINVWDSIHYYRNDELCNPLSWKWHAITGVLCDDGVCNYDDNPSWGPSGIMHISRAPANRHCKNYTPAIIVADLNLGLLHFKSVNLQDINVKKVWYMCLEFIKIREDENNMDSIAEKAHNINTFYHNEFASILCDQSAITISPVPKSWIAYPWLEKTEFKEINIYRKNDIIHWINTYGPDYFTLLDIWNIDWIRALKN